MLLDRSGTRSLRSASTTAFLMALLISLSLDARASTPRWTTGPPYFTVSNTVVIWYTDQPLYYTDPGDLSASVNHAAADALVAAAAGVWNVPSARMLLQQGGALDEHVSGTNTYPDANGLVFPPDVDSSNYAAKQIAVVYDRDGSVTDLLLGGGASDPIECRQNAVTESVDSITTAGFIQHAVLILNGRCTGPAAAQQLQMQYQLERAFGRVLGLGWSQLNDNVFTGTPQPNNAQALHWPIMHPIDVICGPYSYQCLPQPFTLRDDDIASITMAYPVTGTVPPGKELSSTHAATQDGGVYFPTGEGMAGVNVVIRRNPVPTQVLETFDDVSAVTGIFMQQVGGTALAGKQANEAESLGSLSVMREVPFGFDHDTAGYYYFAWITPPVGSTLMDELFRTEPINPLYTGTYAVGPYPISSVTPSGTSVTWRINGTQPGYYGWYAPSTVDAASTCSTAADGTEAAPNAPDPSGWWSNVICGFNTNPALYAHAAWSALPIRAGRSLTVEVTALDESAFATANKLRPVLGLWSGADPVGLPPTQGVAATAYNSVVLGMTTMAAQTTAADTLRLAITDERGDGRPDYNYLARVLYADTNSPGSGSAGTQMTITGMGFRPGNTVAVGGVAAKVSNWTSTAIVVTVPFVKSISAGTSSLLDVVVGDLSTQGSTSMTAAFQYVYTAPIYTMQVLSAPTGNVALGVPAAPSFVVQVLDTDGVTPLPGAAVVFSVIAGSASWSGCVLTTCTATTNAQGQASLVVTPTALGSLTLQASTLGASQMVTFTVVPLVRSAVATPAVEYLAAGATVNWPVLADFLQQGVAAAAVPVSWTVGQGPMTLSPASSTTNNDGTAQVLATAGPLAPGTQAIGSACAWGGVCAGFASQGVDPSEFVVVLVGGAGQSLVSTSGFSPVSLEITNAAGDPIAGASVQIHQTLSQWTPPCSTEGRCPVAPVYQVSTLAGISDSGGMLSFTPLQIAGPEATDIVVTSGTQGFLSFTLQKHP